MHSHESDFKVLLAPGCYRTAAVADGEFVFVSVSRQGVVHTKIFAAARPCDGIPGIVSYPLPVIIPVSADSG